MKTTVSKNLLLLQHLEKRLPHDLGSAQDLIADNFVLHYSNSALPEIAGDYKGIEGLQTFFEKLAAITDNTFDIKIHQVIPADEELVGVHANASMMFAEKSFELDAVVGWRILGDRITEAWDIPSIFATKAPVRTDQIPSATGNTRQGPNPTACALPTSIPIL